MRGFYLFVSFCSALICANAQVGTHSMFDGNKRIYYTNIADAEKRIIEYMENIKDFPSQMFADLVLNDDRCFTYDFENFIKASASEAIRPLRIVPSEDGLLRLYTWDSEGGSMSCYSGITSYKIGSDVHSYVSPIGYMSECVSAEDSLGAIACGVTKIKTVPHHSAKNIYIVHTHCSASNIMQVTGLSAFMLTSEGLKIYDAFSDESGVKSSISYYREPSYSFGTSLEIIGTELLVPETVDSDNPYGCPRITGRLLTYKFNGETFRYDRISYPNGLYKQLCNYLYNIVIIQANQWIIRVDKMPNGAIRYASWKGKKEVEVPDLVINNGYCASTNVRNTENSSLFGAKVEKEEKYIFQNGDYFYEVSWIFEGGYEYSIMHSAKIVVKHNDKVLMTLEEAQE